MMSMYAIVTIVVIVLLFLFSAIKILNEYERAVVFRLGRVIHEPKGPGIVIIIPIIDRFVRISLRTMVHDVPHQDVITRDNVTVKINAVVYFRVVNPLKSIIEVENYLYATGQLSQTTLRSVCGQAELDDLLSKREQISAHIQDLLDRQTDPWGIKVSAVELKHIDLPEDMQRAMAKQAEAERERRAKDNQCRRRIPGCTEAQRCCHHHRKRTDCASVKVPADNKGNIHRGHYQYSHPCTD